ncbi:amidohydrolase, partial [Deltaproteobacteria bacterium]|nr:amidohydrolase [Deltaproteobacteria bacterium]
MEEQNGRRSFLKGFLSLSAVIAASNLSLNKSRGFKIGKTGPTEALGMGVTGKRVKKIAVEEHCHTQGHLEWLWSKTEWEGAPAEEARIKIADIGEGRIKEMDEAGVDMQVLSLSYPDLDPFNTADAIVLARIVNDELAEAVKQHPDRFASFCCLPLQDPEAAADELERAVTKLGLKGVMVNETEYTPERRYSDPKYEVLYERLAKLNVPMYLHQRESGERLIPDMIELIGSNLLDKYPGLQFI